MREGRTSRETDKANRSKREESIQDVPIAVSAFSAETLDAMKIEGGSELLRAIPNVTFSKSNFSMYNFAIRGIGTKAISSSSDPAVAVSFNNSPLIRNRLFEAEYLDVNRVEVLRGPQGTLYGRNATAGVVNMIPNLPKPDFDAMMKAEVGNFGSVRGQMMLNIPLSDTFWVRGAASMTKRDGFDFNTYSGENINGRDLHTVRLSAAWEPTDQFKANLIWERFGEDDDRLRTGKQLCTRDPGITKVGSFTVTNLGVLGKLNQGCLPGSLYDDAAYGAPNASGFGPVQVIGNLITIGGDRATTAGRALIYAIDFGADPYSGVTQSKNLREISTSYQPKFNASNDVFQINLEYQITDRLKIFSQTMYTQDSYYSTQDYARYMSNPIFNDSDDVFAISGGIPPFPRQSGTEITPGGYFTDPQLGPSKGMMSADLSQSESNQFYQEFRLQSNFDGAFDFSIGLNYLDFDVEDNYYIFNNTFKMMAQYLYAGYTDGRILRTRILPRFIYFYRVCICG
jgi:iron complex outermembrane receptor protein